MSGAAEFATERLAAWHARGHVPSDDWQRLAALVPMASGELAVVDRGLETFAQTRDVGLVGTYAINEICARLLHDAGATGPLLAMRDGRLRLALCLTERESGSDLGALRTAVRRGPPDLLSGRKCFIANGVVADAHVVAARAGEGGALPLVDLYLVDRAHARVTGLPGAGAALMPLADVEFVDVEVTDGQRIGRPGRGFTQLDRVLGFERAVIALLATHVARVLLEDLGRYLAERTVFGSALAEHGHHRLRLGGWWAEYRVLRTASAAVVAAHGAGTAAWQDVFALKLQAAAFVTRLATEMQHLGGADSWVDGGRWTALVDDVRWLQLAGGVPEVLQDRLARDAGRRHPRLPAGDPRAGTTRIEGTHP